MIQKKIQTIVYSNYFFKSFDKLPTNIKNSAYQRDKWFRENAFDARLEIHKLKGKLHGFWSYSIGRKYRVLFNFKSSNKVIYYDIGSHQIYK